MKIVFTTEFFPPIVTGVGNHVVALAKSLRDLGNEVRILTFSNTSHSYVDGDVFYIRSIGIRISPDSYISVTLHDPLVDELIEWKPDVVHSHNEFFSMRFAKRISRACQIPIIHTCHTNFDAYRPRFIRNDSLWYGILKIFHRLFLNHATTIIALSRKPATLLESYGFERVIVVPGAIDGDRFNPQKYSTSEREELKHRIGIPLNAMVFLSVSRLSSEKNPVELVDLLAKIILKNIDAVLVLVGEGPQRPIITSRAEAAGISDKVFLIGKVEPDKIQMYYQIGDFYVSTSQGESQGLSYLEALSSGLPVLCKEVHDRALEGILVQDVNGYMFNSHDEFIDIILRAHLDEEKRKMLSVNALVTSKLFSLEKFGISIQEVYTEAIQSYLNGR